ncbi:MAG: biotin/lipoyl-binding protein, partial [Clostridiales bacterium]|nr:biotin/lipoyl-binding protein [Clostridiales bacterium]
MHNLILSENKVLILSNVISRNIPEKEITHQDKQLAILQNWIKAKGYQTKGPVVLYSSGIKGNRNDGNPIVDSKILIQLKNENIRIEYPYQFKQQIRIENCLFVKFSDKVENAQFATMKMRVYAYENDLDLTGETYSVLIEEKDKSMSADLFMQSNQRNVKMNREYTYEELKESKLIFDRKPPKFGVIIVCLTLFFVTVAIIFSAFATKVYVVKATGMVQSESKVNIMNRVSSNIDRIEVIAGQEVKQGDVLLKFNTFQVDLQIAQLQAMVDMFDGQIALIDKMIVFINDIKMDGDWNIVNPDIPFDNTNIDEMYMYSNAQSMLDYVVQQKESETDEDKFTPEKLESLKSQFLGQQFGNRDTAKSNLVQQKSQRDMYVASLAEYTVRAEIDGVVNLTAGLTVGTMLQAGTLLGSISSKDDSLLIFETTLSAQDRARVNVGDYVETVVAGVVQQEFGVLKGEVIHIDSDSTQTQDGQVYFRIRIRPNQTYLTDRKGNRVDLVSGMLAE